MCWTEKCCFSVRLDLGCLLIGVTSFCVSLLMSISSVAMLAMEGSSEFHSELRDTVHHMLGLVHLDVNHASKVLILGIILFVTVLWMMTSLALTFGVKLNRAGFVLVYFTYGIFITFLALLSSLLFLLQSAWIIALVLVAVSLTHIHFLVVVHSFYELLLRGKSFSGTEEIDEQLLIG